MRALGLLAGLAFLIAACSGTPPATTSPSPTPTASVDIKRAKLDITLLVPGAKDVHKVSSKKVLEGAIAALNAEIKKTGGKGEIATIEFQDVADRVPPTSRSSPRPPLPRKRRTRRSPPIATPTWRSRG